MHTGVRWGNLKERGHLKDTVIDDRIMLNRILKNEGGIT